MPDFNRNVYEHDYEVEVETTAHVDIEFEHEFSVSPENFIDECDTGDTVETVVYGLNQLDDDDIQSVVNRVNMEARTALCDACGVEFSAPLVDNTPPPVARSTTPKHITDLTREELTALPEDTKNTLRELLDLEISPYLPPTPPVINAGPTYELRVHPMLKLIIDALEPGTNLHESLINEMRALVA